MRNYLIAVGACYLDTILTVPHFPLEDSKLRASSIAVRRGGNSPNSLEVLQQLLALRNPSGMKLVFAAAMPSSSSAAVQMFKASLRDVDLDACFYRQDIQKPASSWILRSEATSSRTIVNHNVLPEMSFDEFVRLADSLGTDAAWYHFEGRNTVVALRCIRYVRAKYRAGVSVEVEKLGREGLADMAAEADVVFYSRTWAESHGYQRAEDFLRSNVGATPNASLLCCTWAEHGAAALAIDSSRTSFAQLPAVAVKNKKVIDTIGAGDTFIAGMLYGVCCRDEWSTEQKLNFATRLAGNKVVREGFEGLGQIMRDFL